MTPDHLIDPASHTGHIFPSMGMTSKYAGLTLYRNSRAYTDHLYRSFPDRPGTEGIGGNNRPHINKEKGLVTKKFRRNVTMALAAACDKGRLIIIPVSKIMTDTTGN